MKCLNCGMEIFLGQTVCPRCGCPVNNNNDNTNSNINSTNINKVNSFNGNPLPVMGVASFKDNTVNNQFNSQEDNINSFVNLNNNPSSDNTISNNSLDFGEKTQSVESMSSSNNQPKSKKSKKGLVIGIIIFVILVCLGISAWFVYKKMSNPRSVFTNMVDVFANKALEPTTNNHKQLSQKFSFDANIQTNLTSFNNLIDILNKLDVTYDNNIDYEQGIVVGNILVNYDENRLIGGQYYGQNDWFYIKSDELYSKYIKFPFDFNSSLNKNNGSISAYQNMVEELQIAIKKSLKDSYFNSSRDSIKINEKTIKVVKNEMVLNNKTFKMITDDIINYLSSSEKFISSVSNLTNKSKESIVNLLNDIKKENVSNNINENLYIDIYTKGLKSEFVSLNINDGKTTSLNLNKISNDNYEIILSTTFQSIKINVNIQRQADIDKYSFSYSDGATKVEVNIGYKLSYDKEFTKLDVTDSIGYNELTEQDINEIMNNIESSSNLSTIIQNIESLSDLDSTSNSLYSDEEQKNDISTFNTSINNMPSLTY